MFSARARAKQDESTTPKKNTDGLFTSIIGGEAASMITSVANHTDPKRLLSKFKRNTHYTLDLSVEEIRLTQDNHQTTKVEYAADDLTGANKEKKKKKRSFINLEEELFGSSTSSSGSSDEDSYWCEIDPSWYAHAGFPPPPTERVDEHLFPTF